jgi:hypothetical protein
MPPEQSIWRVRFHTNTRVCVCVCVCVYIYIYIYIYTYIYIYARARADDSWPCLLWCFCFEDVYLLYLLLTKTFTWSLCRAVDPAGDRTIGVLTKIDLMDKCVTPKPLYACLFVNACVDIFPIRNAPLLHYSMRRCSCTHCQAVENVFMHFIYQKPRSQVSRQGMYLFACKVHINM